MLRHRALHQRNRRAYTFLVDGETENAALTYDNWIAARRAIASTLADRGASPGDRAILLYPPGLDFITAFFGAIYAGVIAVPCYPPHRSQLARSLPRLTADHRQCEPSVVLCPAELRPCPPGLRMLRRSVRFHGSPLIHSGTTSRFVERT
jgi:acyl-CoA synthetase (AMP-forming)/AMP-acid ligase II